MQAESTAAEMRMSELAVVGFFLSSGPESEEEATSSVLSPPATKG